MDELSKIMNKNMKKVINESIKSLEVSVNQITDLGVTHLRELIEQPGSGKKYVYENGPTIASAPGESPVGKKSGPLWQSITKNIIENHNSNLEGHVVGYYGSTVRYAIFLEYGWKRGNASAAPRPFFRPTREWVANQVPGIVARNWIRYRNAAIKSLPKNSNVEYIGKIR